MPPYSPQQKAFVLARLATGASLHTIARETGIARSTLKDWRDVAAPSAPVAPQKATDELGAKVYDWVAEGVETLTAQVVAMRDPAWLRQQNARDLAILHGTLFDKTATLLGSLRVREEPEDTGECARSTAREEAGRDG